MRSFVSIVAAPVLCLGVLGAAVWENSRHAQPADAVAFHAAAAQAIAAWPSRIGDWNGRDHDLPPAAINLLKPNAHFYREFYNSAQPRRPVSLLVVQCRRASDMSGHYPPNCYPRNGKPMVWEGERIWPIPGEVHGIRGMEYHFEYGSIRNPQRTIVYNFFVLPDKGVVPDMQQVRDASGNFQRRHFGAAQIQVVFEDDGISDQAWRDQVFQDLIGANPGVLKVLSQAIK